MRQSLKIVSCICASGAFGYYLGSHLNNMPLGNSDNRSNKPLNVYFQQPITRSQQSSTRFRDQYPKCIHHHIGELDWPANTVYALNQSLKKFPINNVTLMLSSDGYPIAYHGFDLDKITNGAGNPENYKLQELQRLDAAYKFSAQHGYPQRDKSIQIPTLKELLLALPSNTKYKLILDLKSRDNFQLIKSAIETINAMNSTQDYWNQIIFYSTDEAALARVKIIEPRAQVF